MNITEQIIGDVVVVKLAGRLDATTAPSTSSQLQHMLSANVGHLILDLSDLSYMSSAGIRVLQGLLQAARRQSSDVRLAGMQSLVRHTLDLVGLLPVLQVYDDVATALASIG